MQAVPSRETARSASVPFDPVDEQYPMQLATNVRTCPGATAAWCSLPPGGRKEPDVLVWLRTQLVCLSQKPHW